MTPVGAPRADSAEPPDPRHPVAVSDDQDRPVDRERLAAVARHAMTVLHVPPRAGLEVSLVGPDRIAELKGRFLGEAAPTDVLSFPIDAPGEPAAGEAVLGAVVICPAVAERQARALGRGLGEELAFLLVHGILHLVGRDHDTPEAERAMSREQARVLALRPEEARA